MGYLKYIKDLWRKGKTQENMKDLRIDLRKENSTVRLARPTRLDKARSLGYKAKQGFVIVRQRVKRGGRMREQVSGGRRSAHSGRNKVVDKNYQRIAEERANKKYPNCEVLNSYYLTKDGQYFWYEIILLDRTHPVILKDPKTNWALFNKDRANRGLTSAGRKSRGLSKKGKGSEKTR